MKASEYKARQVERTRANGQCIRYNPPFKLEGWGPGTMRWIENASGGLRVINVPERERSLRNATGYYVDDFGEVTVPHVLQLPAANVPGVRCERYMAAASDPYNADCYITDCDIADNLHDACQWAHRLAERYAEICREGDAKFQAESQIESLKEDICGYREQASRLVEEIRRARELTGDIPLIVLAARKQLKSLRDSVRAAHKRIDRLRDNFWYAVHE